MIIEVALTTWQKKSKTYILEENGYGQYIRLGIIVFTI